MKRIINILLFLLLSISLQGQVIRAMPYYIPPVSGTPPVTSPYTKTFSVWNNTVAGEDLADNASTGYITYSRDAEGDGVAKFVVVASGASKYELAVEAANTTTWEDWGVPVGSTVTKIEVVNYDKKLVANTGLTALAYHLDLIGATVNADIVNNQLLTTVNDDLGTDANYVSENGSGEVSIDAGSQASNSVVRLQLTISESSTVSGADIRFDNIALKITFTDP